MFSFYFLIIIKKFNGHNSSQLAPICTILPGKLIIFKTRSLEASKNMCFCPEKNAGGLFKPDSKIVVLDIKKTIALFLYFYFYTFYIMFIIYFIYIIFQILIIYLFCFLNESLDLH